MNVFRQCLPIQEFTLRGNPFCFFDRIKKILIGIDLYAGCYSLTSLENTNFLAVTITDLEQVRTPSLHTLPRLLTQSTEVLRVQW